MNVLNGPTVHHSQGSRYNTISRHSHWPPCTCTIPYIALTKNSYEYSLSKYQVLYIILCVFFTRIWISSPKFEIHSVAPGTAICYCSATFLKMWPLANVDDLYIILIRFWKRFWIWSPKFQIYSAAVATVTFYYLVILQEMWPTPNVDELYITLIIFSKRFRIWLYVVANKMSTKNFQLEVSAGNTELATLWVVEVPTAAE